MTLPTVRWENLQRMLHNLPRVTRSTSVHGSSDTLLYIGMDATQKRELNKLAPHLRVDSDSYEEQQNEDGDSSGWDLNHPTATAGTSSSSDLTTRRITRILESYGEAIQLNFGERSIDQENLCLNNSQTLRHGRV